MKNIIRPLDMPDFVETPYVKGIEGWVLAYIKAETQEPAKPP